MKFIKNDFVDMDWDAEGFFESRENGFVGAVWIYEGSKGEVPICFHDGAAFLMVDEDGNLFSRDQIRKCLAEVNRDGGVMSEYYEENYVLLGTVQSGIEEDNVMLYGLTLSDAEDVAARLGDVSCYWVEIDSDEE